MNEILRSVKENVLYRWNRLSIEQRVLGIGVSSLVILMMAVMTAVSLTVTVYMLTRPELVDLVSSNDTVYIAQIRDTLQKQNIGFVTPDDRTIQVKTEDIARVRVELAEEGVIGPQEGPGYSLFATTRLGMTDQLFDVMNIKALEEEIATTILNGTNYDWVRVTLSLPDKLSLQNGNARPSALVKIIERRPINATELIGIQNLVANAVPQMQPESVAIFDSSGKKLAGL